MRSDVQINAHQRGTEGNSHRVDTKSAGCQTAEYKFHNKLSMLCLLVNSYRYTQTCLYRVGMWLWLRELWGSQLHECPHWLRNALASRKTSCVCYGLNKCGQRALQRKSNTHKQALWKQGGAGEQPEGSAIFARVIECQRSSVLTRTVL